MFVFGGRHERHQISQIRDCHLERVGSLEFEFWDGACATSSLDQVVLCFVKADNNDECYVSSAPSGPYETIQRSIYSHMSTRIASSDGAFTPRLFLKIYSYRIHPCHWWLLPRQCWTTWHVRMELVNYRCLSISLKRLSGACYPPRCLFLHFRRVRVQSREFGARHLDHCTLQCGTEGMEEDWWSEGETRRYAKSVVLVD